MSEPTGPGPTGVHIELPPGVGVTVTPAPRGSDGFMVVLDMETTTFQLHPADASAIGWALIKAGDEAARRSA